MLDQNSYLSNFLTSDQNKEDESYGDSAYKNRLKIGSIISTVENEQNTNLY